MRSSLKNAWMSSKAREYVTRTSAYYTGPLTSFQKKVGLIPKDASAGPFADEWKKAYGDISKDVEEVDISLALSGAAFAVKDENELVGSTTRGEIHLRR